MDILLTDLSKSFGEKTVLSHLSARFPQGECTGVMGPSGRGKTTLFQILLGLTPPDSGKIEGLDGLRCSAVFQEERLLEGLSALDNVAFVLPRGFSREIIGEHLLALGLGGSESLPVRELSGGMRRRVSLARAVLSPSDLLLLDEPFQGLDEATRQKAIKYLLDHRAGRTLLLITHNPADCQDLGCQQLLDLGAQ